MDSEEEKTMKNCKRGEYAKYSPGEKIELAKYSAEHGIMATWNLTHEADVTELYHVIAYKWSSKFNSWNVLMEVNFKDFLHQNVPTLYSTKKVNYIQDHILRKLITSFLVYSYYMYNCHHWP